MLLVQRRVVSWRRVWKSFQAFSTHGFIFSFTLLLALKLDHLLYHSWWYVFTPFWWLYHAVFTRGRFSLPTPPMHHDEDWAPFHSVMATPLLVAFEILLFLQLDKYIVDFKIVCLPLLAFELAILADNVRRCRPLMCGETMSDEDVCEPLPHLWVSTSIVFFVAATTFTLFKSRGDVAALERWDLFINSGTAQCVGFLVCKIWSSQSIHRYSHILVRSSSSTAVRYQYLNRGLVETTNEESSGICMKIPFIAIQIILFMSLEGRPASPKNIPVLVLFAPLFLLQGAVVLFATYRLVEKHVLLICSVGGSYGRHFATSTARIFLGFFQRCARLFCCCCWYVDEGSREEQARLYTGEATGYNTFSPEVVKKMPKSDLVEEVRRLRAALSEQTDISKQEYEKLQDEKILCKVCIVEPMDVVLLPCKHRVLCSTCLKKCKYCPICRGLIEEGMHVYDA